MVPGKCSRPSYILSICVTYRHKCLIRLVGPPRGDTHCRDDGYTSMAEGMGFSISTALRSATYLAQLGS